MQVDWSSGNPEEEKSWCELNRVSHTQFPCRKQSKLLKGRFYANSPSKANGMTKHIHIEFPDEKMSAAHLKVRDITGNANKLLKRLIDERETMKKKDASLLNKSKVNSGRKVQTVRKN